MSGHGEKPALPQPARYLPFLTGRYDVKPGLRRFGTDFGNGALDQHIFQLDEQLPMYRAEKLAARRMDLTRCHVTHDYLPGVEAAVTQFVIERLCAEHPALFRFEEAQGVLACALTNETLRFDRQGRLVGPAPYVSALDALACQVQEDLAVTIAQDQRSGGGGGGGGWLAALHVCLPSHWDPRKKIGGSFAAVHEVVPGMAPISARQDHFVRQMIEATDGLVRFVWGVQRGSALNRHPDYTPQPSGGGDWFVRVERQTIWGLPQVSASLFTIRPYLFSADEVRNDETARRAMIQALEGMSEEAAKYKGLATSRDVLIDWFDAKT